MDFHIQHDLVSEVLDLKSNFSFSLLCHFAEREGKGTIVLFVRSLGFSGTNFIKARLIFNHI